MKINIIKFVFIALLFPLIAGAQSKTPPPNWYNLDYSEDGVMGISTEKAYRELLQGKEGQTVIVAVIDGGIDVEHEDLRDVMWINVLDSAATGNDEDGNGYINDKYGWNFLGNASGENVHYDNLEMTRLLRILEPKYASVLPSTPLGEAERREFNEYQRMASDYAAKLQQAHSGQYNYIAMKRMTDSVVARMGVENPTLDDFNAYKPADDMERTLVRIIRSELKDEPDFNKFYEQLTDGVEYFTNQVKYHLNKDFDPRHIVGDDYENSYERYYGNADVAGPDAEHGTHVAGIIAAVRDNGVGVKGVADNVRIMALRAVPDGDEHDKDVANAIRYAVENGAKVINMSFGKGYAKDKLAVDEAVRYAVENDVLLVHAAGNDAKNIDEEPNFPNKYYVDSLGINKGAADSWITVGATQWENNNELLASFSNYGKRSVDVFAPGVKIHSTMPGSTYKDQQGTSMAAPVVSGLAALIRSYYPAFSAVEVKEIIMDSVTPISQRVKIRDEAGRSTRVSLDSISVTGGVVNAYRALQLASERAK